MERKTGNGQYHAEPGVSLQFGSDISLICAKLRHVAGPGGEADHALLNNIYDIPLYNNSL